MRVDTDRSVTTLRAKQRVRQYGFFDDVFGGIADFTERTVILLILALTIIGVVWARN